MLYPIQNDIRNKFDLSGIWDFQIDPEETGEVEGWFTGLPVPRPISVPGSWNEQYADLFNYFGLGWYVTKTYVPSTWKGQRIFLRVGSANYAATLYLNGTKVGSHEGGHLPFAFEITDIVNWDCLNTLAISVENHLRPTRVPSAQMEGGADAASLTAGFPSTTFDFFPFAGIHRPVVLYSVPEIHLSDLTVVTEIAGSTGLLKIQASLTGDRDAGRLILTGGGKTLEAPLTFQGGVAEANLQVPDACFWSDQTPYLYDLTVVTSADKYSLKVGIRTVKVAGKQMLLNGKPVQLNGFGRHEDFIASGKGLNIPLLIKDYDLMRWTGANSYRTSHYPYSEEEMMLADREGFLIIDETPAVSLQFDNVENMAVRKAACLRQIDEMITRDKNHPSVVMWSVANEPMPADLMARYTNGTVDQEKETASMDFLQSLVARARQNDPTRPVTLVGLMGGPPEWFKNCDVVCINRYFGWYLFPGELEKSFTMIEQELDTLWEMLGKPIMITEFGTDTQPGLHGHPAVMWTEEYQAAFIRGYLEVGALKDFVTGMHVWNFADFAAVQSIVRVGGMNMKGVFTRTRQPKMAAHVLREFWTRQGSPAREQAVPTPSTPEAPAQTAGEKEIKTALEDLAARLNGKKPDLTTTLMFDFGKDGTYRLIINHGNCHVEHGEGDAAATMVVTWADAKKMFVGKLDPMVAVMTGRVKTRGNARALLVLQDVR